MMHLHSAFLCIVVHPKRFTIMWGGGVSPQPQDNGTSALTTPATSGETSSYIFRYYWDISRDPSGYTKMREYYLKYIHSHDLNLAVFAAYLKECGQKHK